MRLHPNRSKPPHRPQQPSTPSLPLTVQKLTAPLSPSIFAITLHVPQNQKCTEQAKRGVDDDVPDVRVEVGVCLGGDRVPE